MQAPVVSSLLYMEGFFWQMLTKKDPEREVVQKAVLVG